ncbi:monooxygenase 1-like [Rutidosis leptorrhynchoides]|uniref:monooxygenase 1-like n=1 Tax=Rutidosis leptorrhynchoides TaxID=125765 RepID=UPI003A9954C2
MDNNNNDEVVIIGAGICGLATALALYRKGIKSVVMERSESLRNTTGTSIITWQNGWRALEQLGVAETLRRTAVPIQTEQVVWLNEGKQEESPVNHEFRGLLRKDLINSLYNALPPDTVKFGCQLESIKMDLDTNKPVIRFINGTSITPKVVIGCEGGNSIVANFLNVKPTKLTSLCVVRGLTNYPNGHSFDRKFTRFHKNNIIVGRYQRDDNMVFWFCVHPYIPKDRRNWDDPEVIRRSTMKLLNDFPPEVQSMIEKAESNSLSYIRIRYRTPWDLFMGTFSKGTVTVAGDAMHIMGPFMGQGGSAGLEDTVVLARNMARLGLNGERKITVQGVEEAFKIYVKERRMRVVQLSLQTYLTGLIFGASSSTTKVLYFVLLSVLFRNSNGHIDYDCGVL